MLQSDNCVFSEGHEIRKQETVRRMNLVFRRQSFLDPSGADRMSRKWQRHIQSAPVIAASSPLFGPCAVRLRSLAVIEKESRIALQRRQNTVMREYEGSTHKTSGPVPSILHCRCIEQDEILA